jgi:hypothetical protein
MPLCNYCKNIGLKTANNHFTYEGKDSNYKLICPELLKTKCRYCKAYGHTISYCPTLIKKDYQRISNAIIQYTSISSLVLFNINNNIKYNTI